MYHVVKGPYSEGSYIVGYVSIYNCNWLQKWVNVNLLMISLSEQYQIHIAKYLRQVKHPNCFISRIDQLLPFRIPNEDDTIM